MAKIIVQVGNYRVFQVKPKVLAVYKNDRFYCNLRPADYGFAAPAAWLRNLIGGEADARAERAARVRYGIVRKAAARAASADNRQVAFAF